MWKDSVKHGVEMYGFIIRGKGKMNGKDFANHIRNVYECSAERTKAILLQIEKHVIRIESTYKGIKYWTV